MEPNFVAAIECSKYWNHVVEQRREALQKFSEMLPGIIEVESCNSTVSMLPGGVAVSEAKLWSEVNGAVTECLESSTEIADIIEADFYEPHTYFGSTCFEQAKSKLHHINGISSGSDEHIDASLKAVQEWNIYRNIRHKVMLKYFENAASTMMLEVRSSCCCSVFCCVLRVFYLQYIEPKATICVDQGAFEYFRSICC